MPSPYPYIRVLSFSDPMVGKSTFAATFPKRMVVCSFDPHQKDSPYLDKGYYDEPQVGEDGTPWRDVVDANGELLIRIYYFHDENPEKPSAFKRFQRFMHGFDARERVNWETLVIDSVSAMSRACKLMHEFDLNPDYKDPRKWYADTADSIERMLTRFASMMDINLVLLCHISRKTDEAAGTILRMVKLPGRMGMDGPDGFPEVYRMYVQQGTGARLMQTQKNGNDSWLAGSQFCKAPSPCEPRYSAIWANWSDRSRKPLPVSGEAGAVAAPTDAQAGAPATQETGTDG